MNERIKELRKQAIEFANATERDTDYDKWDAACDAKFAELIVKECIQQLRYKSAQLVDVDYFPEYKEQLEKHFGIKE